MPLSPNSYFSDARDFEHSGKRPPVGVLLVNLGSPAAPSARALRPYLRQFLSDRRVVEAPRLLWWLILNLIILPTRSPKSARAYAAVWSAAGAPLLSISAAQQQGLAQALGPDYAVELAMSYGQPAIAPALQRLRAQRCQRLIILPLYPQYASATVGSVFTDVWRELVGWRWIPSIACISGYYRHPLYIEALATSVVEHQRQHGRPDLLLCSFHGTPLISLFQGDPYHCQCRSTARRLAERLQLKQDQWQLSFQSRFGKQQWLQPYTDASLERLARAGVKRVQVICPGFSADCLETLEEIEQENREIFLQAGGEQFSYIPALNDAEAHIGLLSALVREHSGSSAAGVGDQPQFTEQISQLRSEYYQALSPAERRLADELNNASS